MLRDCELLALYRADFFRGHHKTQDTAFPPYRNIPDFPSPFFTSFLLLRLQTSEVVLHTFPSTKKSVWCVLDLKKTGRRFDQTALRLSLSFIRFIQGTGKRRFHRNDRLLVHRSSVLSRNDMDGLIQLILEQWHSIANGF